MMANLPLWILGAAFVAAFVAYMRGRIDGASLERGHQAASEAKARTIADEVQNDIGAMAPETRREELKRWAK